MTNVLVTIRLDDGETEQYHIDYLPTLEAAYAANYGGRRPAAVPAPPAPAPKRVRVSRKRFSSRRRAAQS